MTTITVSPTYQGISGLAHGGYLAGLLTERSRTPMGVTLRQPPPLETPLTVEHRDDSLRLVDPQGLTVMEGQEAESPGGRLPAVPLEEARSREEHPRFREHPFPDCFVCGTQREDGFGVRISAPDENGVATGTWTPRAPLLPDEDVVPSPFVWAVVDCLTAWSFADHWDEVGWWPAVTGQIVAELTDPVSRGEPHVVVGRLTGREGRRLTLEGAVVDADGRFCAHAEAVWIVLRETPEVPSDPTARDRERSS